MVRHHSCGISDIHRKGRVAQRSACIQVDLYGAVAEDFVGVVDSVVDDRAYLKQPARLDADFEDVLELVC